MSIPKDKQLHIIGDMRSGVLVAQVKYGLVVIAVAFLVAAVITRHPWCMMLAIFFGLVASGVWKNVHHVSNAARATTEGVRQKGLITIYSTRGDMEPDYHAAVTDEAGQKWTIDFRPTGWTPKEGEQSAEIVFVKGIAWPSLIITGEGTIVPKHDPGPPAA
ncbi:MAG: hypothetical protein K8I00_02140 [Candidatus Omnitrophica bacterium]|nr:hypothetical protein [Candidatus Omnitrophota bacterium]